MKNLDLGKYQRFVPLTAVVFWVCFFLTYQYRELMDDSQFRLILENKVLYQGLDAFSRPLHSLLLYVQGLIFDASMDKAMFISVLFHLTIGWLAWTRLIPALPASYQTASRYGLLAFLIHPVSLQTVVHVAQRSEILGTLFCVLAFETYFKARARIPAHRDFAFLALFGVGALLSKEPYVLVPFSLLALLTLSSKNPTGKLVTLGMIPVILLGVSLNSFSGKLVHNESNYARTAKFFESVEKNQDITPADSVMFPVRTRMQNLQVQAAVLPLVVKAVFLPFGVLRDYGQFPYGRNYSQTMRVGAVAGIAILLALAFAAYRFRNRLKRDEWALIAMPAALYSVYWLFPVYDPIFLYRLYGVVFLVFLIVVPVALQNVALHKLNKTNEVPYRFALAVAVLTALCVAGGVVRAHEMRTPITQAQVELERGPDNYRNYIDLVYAIRKTTPGQPLDCRAVLEPALKLASSPAWIYGEWAWCLNGQGRTAEAAEYAKKSLEYEANAVKVQEALQVMLANSSNGVSLGNVHPANMKALNVRNLASPDQLPPK